MKKILSVLILLFVVTGVYAQSNEVITEIQNSKQVSFGQVCYLSAVYQGLVSEDATYSQSINALYDLGQVPAQAYETDQVVMVNLSFIFAQAFDIKGGLFYKMTHGSPRYAFKQMKADGLISDTISPDHIVTGSEALNLFTDCNLTYAKLEVSVE